MKPKREGIALCVPSFFPSHPQSIRVFLQLVLLSYTTNRSRWDIPRFVPFFLLHSKFMSSGVLLSKEVIYKRFVNYTRSMATSETFIPPLYLIPSFQEEKLKSFQYRMSSIFLFTYFIKLTNIDSTFSVRVSNVNFIVPHSP